MGQTSSIWVRHAALVFALKTFAAAMLAYTIALWLDMPRPFWAMTTVFITAHPLSGATSSKAVYRILGTLIGAAGLVALIPNLVNAPELLTAVIAIWIGVFVYLSLIDGTPRAYVFMLAGYSIPLLGFPILSAPGLTFDIVSSRVQEILTGIIVATAVSALVLPRSVASAITAQAEGWLAGARQLGAAILNGQGTDQERDKERLRLAAATTGIDDLYRHLGYEAAVSANTARGLRRLRRHMFALLPLLAAIEDRRRALQSQGSLSAVLSAISARVARWVDDGGKSEQEADALRSSLSSIQTTLDAGARWSDLEAAGLVIRLRQLIDIFRDCQVLREAIAADRDPSGLELAFTPDAADAPVLHRDHGLALWSAAAVTIAVLVCSMFWIATGWADGGSAALIAAVIGTFFAGIDEPLPIYRKAIVLMLISILVSGVYTFGVLPRITTIEVLVAALMPTFVLFSWLAARPATAQAGFVLALFTSVQLALQSSYSASFDAFANGSIALVFGITVTTAVVGIVRTAGTRWVASRLLRSNWATLAAVAEPESTHNRAATAGVMQHRLALLAARIAAAPAEDVQDIARQRPLRLALSIVGLREARFGLSRRTQAVIDALLARLASAFVGQTTGHVPAELVRQLDDTISSVLQQSAGEARNDALIALDGIRLGLFPETAAYQPHEPEQRSMAA